MCLSPRPHQPLRGSDLGLGYELGLSVYCPVMPLPQSGLNPMCTYPDVLLYILLFPCFRVARILKRFVTSHERIDAPVSVVLCLPAHLRVSTAASRGQAPHGNASIAFHRRGVTNPSRATRRSSSQLAAHSAAQRLAAPPSDSAESVKEVQGAELRHQRVPSADQQGPIPSYSNHFNNHRPTSTGRTPSPVLHHPPRQPPHREHRW